MLIELVVHHEDMFGLILIALLLVVVGVLAVFAGADSRVDDVARRRRYSG